jgi:DNA-binding transcriptional MerR regulator
MRIGEVAERAGVNIETLRYYERRGLLPAPVRGPGGHRSYDDEAVRFVRAIKETQSLGFTLAEIEEYLRLIQRQSPSAAMRGRVAAKIGEVDAKIASLRRVRDELARVLGCACDSLDRCTCGAAYLALRGRVPERRAGEVLHVTNGESAGNTLRQTGLGGAVLCWNDVLYEGPPVPRSARADFLSACGWGPRHEILHSLERRDELLARADHVVLWFEHDLYDQLQLLQILATGAPGLRELVDPGIFLGPLQVDELRALWPTRREVTPGILELAGAGWKAFTSPEPTAIEAFLERETSALPHLEPALRRLLEELPDTRSGLGRSERQLLEPLLDGPKRPHELFLASQTAEEAAFDGDAWAWRRLAGLQPLVSELPPPPPLGDTRRFTSTAVELTAAGRAVVAGKADRVELIGIDRHLGGTHVTPESVWRWDPVSRCCAAPR